MKIKLIVVLFIWTTFVVNAGDTIFSASPSARSWNPQYMYQVFNDEFNGTNLNMAIWEVDQCMSRGYHGNNEGEPNNITVSNGTLKLTARYSPGNIDNNCNLNNHFVSDFTTAEMWSKWKRYKYGSFEALCIMPKGDHYYYAYWLWGPGGDGFPQDGFTSEIDIAEGCEWTDGSHHNMKSTFHLWPQPGNEIKLPEDATCGYGAIYEGAPHIYKIIWNPYEVVFYIDSKEVWRRSRYHIGSDIKANDIGMNQIQPNVFYHDRAWFPNDEMATVFQMHNTKYTPLQSLPVSMVVDYVRVKQFFLSPEITVPTYVCSTGTATLDVDPLASNITWQLTPSSLFTTSSGTGKTANIVRAAGAVGTGNIKYTFQMPSGETFTANKDIIIGAPPTPVLAGSLSPRCGYTYPYSVTNILATDNATYYWESDILEISNPTSKVCTAWPTIDGEGTISCTVTACGVSRTESRIVLAKLCYEYEVELFPNPSSDIMEVSLTKKISEDGTEIQEDDGAIGYVDPVFNVRVASQMGTVVYTAKTTNKKFSIPVSNFQNGNYYLEINDHKNSYRKQFIVKH